MNGIGDLRFDFLDRDEVDDGEMAIGEMILDVEVGDDSFDRLFLRLPTKGDPLKRTSVIRPWNKVNSKKFSKCCFKSTNGHVHR